MGSMKGRGPARLPLPVSHTRAPLTCTRTNALLALACAFAAGFDVALYTIGLIVTRGGTP